MIPATAESESSIRPDDGMAVMVTHHEKPINNWNHYTKKDETPMESGHVSSALMNAHREDDRSMNGVQAHQNNAVPPPMRSAPML